MHYIDTFARKDLLILNNNYPPGPQNPKIVPKKVSQFRRPFVSSSDVPTLLLPSIPMTPPTPVIPNNPLMNVPPATPVVNIPMMYPPALEVQRRSSPPLTSRKPNKSQSKMLHRAKARVTIKLTILGCIGLLVGGVASFVLLHFTTDLIVSWVILVIVFSNLISQELRSYYWTGLKMTLTTLRMPAVKISNQTKSKGVDVGRNPMMKDIHDTTAYLKALRFLSQDNQTPKRNDRS